MSEVFSIQLSNHNRQEQGGVWLSLPATPEQVQAVMGQIGVTQDNPWDYFISGFSTPENRHLAIPYDMAIASGVNWLNFLAARLEKLDASEIATLNAALQAPGSELRSIGRIIDYADNLDYYVNLPDVRTPAQLGDYYLYRSKMVDMPEEWKPAIDTRTFGQYIARQEQGAFTEYGYILKSGDPWQTVHEGQPIPDEYCVLSFPPPQVERDEPSRPRQELEQTAPASQPVIPIVLTGRNNAERMKEITDKLEAGIQALFESEQYKNYLTAMSKFHNYSFNNTLLIAMQKPDASLVAGYNKWKDEFERHVKRGEKAIKILAPAPYKVRRQVEKLDASGRPIPGPDGKPLTEEQEVTVPAFKVVSVFDVSQTEGRELPDIAVDELTGSVERYQDFFTALERTSPVPVAFEQIDSGAHGYYHLEDRRIAIQEGMSELQTLKTAIHEIAHATLHAIDKDATPEELAQRPDRRTREVQAESVAYTVCQHYGLDTSDYSFGYVAGWSSGKDLSELKASLETIRATANDLITKIDGHLAQLQQEREARQTPPIWNGLDGLINDKPFMPGATPEQQANALIDFAEQDGQRLGNGERRLIVDYANVVRDYHKVADLINELCEQGYELQHGNVDAAVQMRVEREIEEAPPLLLDPDAEPLVTIIWSESTDLRDGEQMPLSQADTVFKALDDAMRDEPGYDKTKFRIDFTMNGKADNYEGRQDFGDGDGSLIEHIQGYHEYYAQSESWKKSVIASTGIEGWEQETAEREMILGEFVPYLKLHCNLSAMEREARTPLQSGETLTPEQTAYFNAVLDYVKECRPLLNQGQYQLPEPPRLADFDVDLQEYKKQVKDEIAQEAAAAGMTVEEYAANGYEAPAAPEQEAVPPTTPEQAEPPAPDLTDLQKRAIEIAKGYEKLPLQDRIDVIARTFGCTSGKIETTPCRGKWRGTSDIYIRFDNGTSLALGNCRTPKAKTVKVRSEYVNAALVQYNPEIVRITKESSLDALIRRSEKDNAVAAEKGVKPYTVLNVELYDGTDDQSSGYIGWYYATLAVDGKICTHLETGLHYDIMGGKVSDTPTTRPYYPAGALKETDVDYVFDNVGFSSTSGLYSLPLHDDVRERAEKTLAERTAAEQEQDTFSIYQLKRGDETRDLRFEPYDRLQAAGLAVDPKNYGLVYTAPLTPGMSLEDIFTRFNIDRPADFKGHSLSVSDVVVLHQAGQDAAHYVDSIGYQEVPEFLRENPLRTAELSTEQNENMIDGVLNNAPSPGEVEAKEKAKEPVAGQPPEPPQAEAPELAPVRYYTINEGAARRAKEANSFYDYQPGSATAEYRSMVDKAVEIAQRQKKRVDPQFHEKIDQLLDTYARLLAQNMNKSYEIAARVPSVMIAGPANFPVKKKQKQLAADDKNMEEWQHIQGLLDKIRSTGMGGISADDPNAIARLQAKLEKLEANQEMMKAVNAYYRKHKTLEGCPHLSQKSIEAFQSSIAEGGRGAPFLPWQLSNNNANIRQVRSRIEQLTRQQENAYVGWEFDGGTVEINREANRLQIFFDSKPDEATRSTLKENGFRWSPKAEAWQRQLNDNTIWVVDRISFLRPLSGEKPSELQAKARKAQQEEKPSIRAQLKAAKEGQQQRPPAKEKSQDLEV